jgi:hypothetical protein
MKQWLKKYTALFIFISIALVFGILYWETLAFFLVVALALVFFGDRLGTEVPKVAQIGAIVFLVSLVMIGAVKYSYSYYAKNLYHRQIAWDMENLDPELIDVPMKAKVFRVVNSLSKNKDSAYAKQIRIYERLHALYLAEEKFDTARFCLDSIVVLNQRASADDEPLRKILKSEKVSSDYQPPVSEGSEGFSRTFYIPKDSLTNLDFVMNGGRTYKLVSNRRFKMKCSDGMFYDIPTELTWPIKEAGVFIPIVLASRELKLTITDVTEDM